ncbi:MAG: hypothetical protein ACHQJ6_03525 [Candidatus Berkiellales bacterium]
MLVTAGADMGHRGIGISKLGSLSYQAALFYQIMELPIVKRNPQIESILCKDSDTIFCNIGKHCTQTGSVKEIDVLLRYPLMKEKAKSYSPILRRLGAQALPIPIVPASKIKRPLAPSGEKKEPVAVKESKQPTKKMRLKQE